MMTFAFDLHLLATFAPNFEGCMHTAPSMAECISMGVMHPYDLIEHDMLSYCYYDQHKAAYGCKGRHVDYKRITIAELEQMLDHLDEVCAENDAEEKRREDAAVIAFEQRIQDTIDMGAGDRETALRWIVGAADLNWQFAINDLIDDGLYFGDEYTALVHELTKVADDHNLWPMEVAA